MAQFESQHETLEQSGVGIAFIAGQQAGGLLGAAGYFRKHSLSLPYLLDESRDVLKAYGVYVPLAIDGIRVAAPSAFLIGSNRTIAWRYVGRNQFDRVIPERLLEEIRNRL